MLFEKEKTEEKIIRATFNILQRDGMQKTTTKKIAAEAGVNEVTIFRKFENKKNLLLATKDFYMEKLTERLEETFDFNEDDEVDDYLKSCFYGILNFTEEDFSVLKVAMQEVKDAPEKKLLITEITDTILNKLEEYFRIQIEKGKIKDQNPKAIAILCYSIIFHSLILWQIYGSSENIAADYYAEDFLNIISYGIKPE